MLSLHDWLDETRGRLERQRDAASGRHATPPEQAGALLAMLVPVTCMIWGVAWLIAGRSGWVTIPLATAATVFFFRCLPASIIPLHVPVVPKLGNWFLVAWLFVGWAGMLWIVLR